MVSLASAERAFGLTAPSAGNLKRKTFDPSSDAEHATSSQLKRRRVTFDPDVDVRILSDENEKSLDLVESEVRRALEKHANGDKAAYDTLKGVFRDSPTSGTAPLSGLLQKYVIALTNNVPLLDHSCKGLVHAVIDCSWIARNEHFVRSYRKFIRSLLSIQPGYMSVVLQVLVNMFLKTPSTSARQRDDPPIQRVRVQARIHDSLISIIRHSPIASTYLAPVLSSTFPFGDDDAKTHVQYIRNILKVSQYCAELKGEILSLITDKVVKIDVQIQVDMEELEDDMEDSLIDATTHEGEEDDESDNESVSSDESLDPEERRLKEIKESVNKLDTIMDLLFSHYDSVFAKGDLFESDQLFESLLSQFANIILPTYRSRHTQFLLFHFSQTSTDFTERFAGACSHLAFDQARPQILRIAAAAYLASFIARGAHVSGAIVRDVFDLLCHHLDSLRALHEPSAKGPDLRRYGTYYAICQALLYTFCFRWRDLIITPSGQPPSDHDILYADTDFHWHAATQSVLRANLFSTRLNPLKICAPSIVAQFARLAHHLRFLYIYPLLETNKRLRLTRSRAIGYLDGICGRETARSGPAHAGGLLLDAYFPFDPYVLPRSRRWVGGGYVEWRGVPGLKEDRDEEEEEEDEEEEGSASESESESGASDEESGESEEEIDAEEEVDDGTGTETSL